jgi:hypothetical protein
MTQSTFAASQIRNVVLCSLLTFGLAACGAGGSSSSADTASASESTSSLVSPNVGFIDRTSSAESGATTVAATTPATSAAPATSTTPVSSTANSSTAASTSTTTVASSNKTSTNPVSTGSGSATLDWMPPTENSDGTVLTNLAGYTVYYGTSPSNLTQSVKITNPGLASYTMSNLPSGTWYFAVTSYSSTGIESTRSGVVSTTI